MRWVLFLLLVVCLASCHRNELRPIHSDVDIQEVKNIAEHFVDAYNQRDVNGMLQWVHEEIRYMYVSGGEIYMETDGKKALHEFLLPFFTNKPQAKSELLSSTQSGSFIHQVERALWQDAAGNSQSQCSLSVYQINDELIINIWYFDVFKCPGG